MTRLTDRLERDLREVAAGARPSPSAWESIVKRLGDDAEAEVVLLPAAAPTRSRRPVRTALAAAAVVVIAGSIALLADLDDDDSISTADQDLTATFVSPRNGFSLGHAPEATVTPAVQLWEFSEQLIDGFDVVESDAAVFMGASTRFTDFLPGVSVDESVDDYLSDHSVSPGSCGIPRREQAAITIDGIPGRVAACPNRIEATVVEGGRLYLFTLSQEGVELSADFDAYVATIDLTPETAVDFPAMTTTFVSPTYGYSFDFHDRGGLAPATELWDPGNQPIEDRNLDERFDAVETGLGAYFEAASTPIPAGVSVDEWVDEHVSTRAAGGCGDPRSEQEEITIDGRPARLATCAHRVEATVVAGGRLYLFVLSHSRNDERAWFDAWIGTIALTPETATVP